MIHLREFATQAEYDSAVSGLKRPNVSLVNEPFSVHYNNYIPLGVFAQHIDGNLYTKEEWAYAGFANDQANGVAVVTDAMRFVIAKEKMDARIWSSNNKTLISGVYVAANSTTASYDKNGKKNTQIMLESDTEGAAYACANFSFPNGAKGYLPSAGELTVAAKYKKEINNILSIIGGQTLTTEHGWSSTQESGYYAWKMIWSTEMLSYDIKEAAVSLRPFTALD